MFHGEGCERGEKGEYAEQRKQAWRKVCNVRTQQRKLLQEFVFPDKECFQRYSMS